MKTIALFFSLSPSLFGALSIHLPGNTEVSGWNQLKGSNPYWSTNGYPTAYPGATAWPGAITANIAGSEGSALLMKESGNGYFAGSSLYDAGGSGIFSVSDNSPLLGLASIVLQIDAGTSIGVPPVFNYNGGFQAIPPNDATQVDGEYLTFNFQTGQSFPTMNRAWQWDLTGMGVTSYKITWGSVPNNHLTQYEINLTTGDTFAQAVPEISSIALLCLGSISLLRRRR
jgi:hypothetical protein